MTLEARQYPDPLKILVIAAHPDDIEFGCAGSVARWASEGAEVYYCLVTDGSAGSNEMEADLEALIKLRREEQDAAAAVVGVKEVFYLGYRDGTLEATLELRRDLTRIIRKLKPYRVVTADPTTIFVEDFYINHPDHRAAAEAAVYAVFPSAETRPIFPELLLEGLEPHKVMELYLNLTPNPDSFVDISDFIEQKLEALRCHQSQINEDVVQMVKGWSSERGKEKGYQYAEWYKVMYFGERPNAENEGEANADTDSTQMQPSAETMDVGEASFPTSGG